MHKWNDKEIDFLKKNYPKFGSEYCSNELNINISKVRSKIQRLKLNLEDKTDVTLFQENKTKESVYILGLLWTDGNINNVGNGYEIKIEANFDDMLNIENTIMMTGNWKKYVRNGRFRNENICKDSICYKIGFKKLYEIFKNYDYSEKSKISPYKVMESIPKNLLHYFYRGIIDGDGCFYVNKKNYNYQFSVSSTYEQNWEYMIELSNYLGIKFFKINKIKNTKGDFSYFRITNKNDILKIGSYIYGEQYDNIGLTRKYNKFQSIFN